MISSASVVDEADQPKDAVLPRPRATKAPTAFRTIGEVAEELRVPQHVLRFWEGRFPQIKPLKRGGGRRYYRPEDIGLLKRIHQLLHVQCYTIKGVQRLLRENGGQLGDDIPPPRPEEQASLFEREFAASAEPQLPMPGLGPPLPAPAPAPKPAKTKTASKPKPAAQAAVSMASQDAILHAEVLVLRHVLRETLAELEAIRALLPR